MVARLAWVWLLSPPPPAAAVGPVQTTGAPAVSGGGGDAGGRVGCVCGRRWPRWPLPPARAAAPRYPARAGARRSSPCSGGGKVTLGSRLGSLTQIRHDKGRVGDSCGGTSLGGAKEGEVAESADPRVCALESRPTGCRFTQPGVLSRLRVKWVRRVLRNVEARPWSASYSEEPSPLPLVTEGWGEKPLYWF